MKNIKYNSKLVNNLVFKYLITKTLLDTSDIDQILQIVLSECNRKVSPLPEPLRNSITETMYRCKNEKVKQHLCRESANLFRFDPSVSGFSYSKYNPKLLARSNKEKSSRTKLINKSDNSDIENRLSGRELVKSVSKDGFYIPGNDDVLLLGYSLPSNYYNESSAKSSMEVYSIPKHITL